MYNVGSKIFPSPGSFLPQLGVSVNLPFMQEAPRTVLDTSNLIEAASTALNAAKATAQGCLTAYVIKPLWTDLPVVGKTLMAGAVFFTLYRKFFAHSGPLVVINFNGKQIESESSSNQVAHSSYNPLHLMQNGKSLLSTLNQVGQLTNSATQAYATITAFTNNA